ncbi:MAG: hypothetical protein Tsb0015_04440 [Simkaniaceae bacterium]
MDEKVPFISIIVLSRWICTHLLTNTLDSVLLQKRKNFELILILSPEAERENRIIQSYRADLSHIYISLSSNSSYMMNCGTKFAQGRYLHFLTPGDYFLSYYATEKIEEFAKEKNFPDLLATGYVLLNKKQPPKINFKGDGPIPFADGFVQRMTQAFLLKKSTVESLEGFKYSYRGEGLDLILQIYFANKHHIENWNIVLTEHEACRIPVHQIAVKDFLHIIKDILGWKAFFKYLFQQNPWQILLSLRELICS